MAASQLRVIHECCKYGACSFRTLSNSSSETLAMMPVKSTQIHHKRVQLYWPRARPLRKNKAIRCSSLKTWMIRKETTALDSTAVQFIRPKSISANQLGSWETSDPLVKDHLKLQNFDASRYLSQNFPHLPAPWPTPPQRHGSAEHSLVKNKENMNYLRL